MTNVLVTGSNGQLGSEINELKPFYKKYNLIFTDLNELDICDFTKVKSFILSNNIDVIINCAAYTSVDEAEENEFLSNNINYKAVANFAEIAKKDNIKLIHISTDYVFDGNSYKPYKEKDSCSPQSVYGNSKMLGEKAMIKANPKNSIIIRTSWVYSKYGKNFVKTMIKLSKTKNYIDVISDQIGSPTYAADLAKMLLEIIPKIKNNSVEIYHYSNQGICSWYDFAKTIFKILNIDVEVRSVFSDDYITKAKRPYYSVLNKELIKKTFSLKIPYWKDSLEICLKKIVNQHDH